MKINRKKLYLLAIIYAVVFSCFVYQNIDNLTIWSTYKFYYDLGLNPYQVIKYDHKLFTSYVVGKEIYMWFAYPPFAFYLLIFFAAPYLLIKKLIGENIIIEILLAKLQSLVGFILASILLYYIVYRKTKDKNLSEKIERLFLLSPLMYFAFFQQALFDVWLLVFYALVFLSLYEWRKVNLAGIFSACAILTKQYFVVFLPVIICAIYRNYDVKKLVEYFLFLFSVSFFIVLPFINFIDEIIKVCLLFHNNRPAQVINIYVLFYAPLVVDKLFKLNIITLDFIITIQKIFFLILFPVIFFGLFMYMIKNEKIISEKEFLYYSLLFLGVFYIFSKVVNPQHYAIGCYVLLILYALIKDNRYFQIFKWLNVLGVILYILNFPQAQLLLFYKDYLSIPIWYYIATILVRIGMLFDVNFYTIWYLIGTILILILPLFRTYLELAKDIFNRIYYPIDSTTIIKVSKLFFLTLFSFMLLISISLPLIVEIFGKYKIKEIVKKINLNNSTALKIINYNLSVCDNQKLNINNMTKEILLSYYEINFKKYELVASGKLYINTTFQK